MSDIKLIVLAGGFGTRLRSVVSGVPKPMAPAGDAPFLKYLVESWVSQGIRHFIFALHHQSEFIEQFILSERMKPLLADCQVDFVCEPEPMGTGGAIAFVVQQQQINGRFLVVNADTWLGGGLEGMTDLDYCALAAVKVPDTSRYGSLKVKDAMVEAFVEKSASGPAGWINAGVYNLHSDLFNGWDQKPFSLEQVCFPKMVAQRQLGCVKLDTDFIDIGVPEDYFRFCKWIESNRQGTL